MKALSIITLLSTIVLSIPNAHAKGPSENASAASKHSILSGSHALKASGQIASGVIAIPLLTIGSIGALSTEAGTGLIDLATGDNGKPLEISDKIITADRSPAEVMKINHNKIEQL